MMPWFHSECRELPHFNDTRTLIAGDIRTTCNDFVIQIYKEHLQLHAAWIDIILKVIKCQQFGNSLADM